MKTFLGRVQKHAQGFAFILSPGISDTYVDKFQANELLSRDRVRFSLEETGGRRQARIHEILERGIHSVYGIYSCTPWPHVITPTGEVYPAQTSRTRNGTHVLAKILRYPHKNQGVLVKIELELGLEILPANDITIATAVFGLPGEFPLSAKLAARNLSLGEFERVNLGNMAFVTIDGEDAKDFDDAVYVESHSGEAAWVLRVAIADVGAFSQKGDALDKEAQHRATSVYLPGHCIPMLPPRLSEDLCSLNQASPKAVLVVELTFDRHGVRLDSKFYRATILSRARMTYEIVQRGWENQSLGELKRPLHDARMLSRKLKEQRRERHTLDFDLAELKFELDQDGRPLRVGVAPHYETHQMIEEFMIAANVAVAERLRESSVLFRIHEAPDSADLGDLNGVLKSLGTSEQLEAFTQKAICRVLEIPNQALHRYILRLQRQARYSLQARGHWGLNLKDYLHFTSPIRRYPDLVAHRALAALIEKCSYTDKIMEDLAFETSDKERRAMEAERFVIRRKSCWFMKPQLGETFSGRVSELSARGIGITLDNGIDGFAPVDLDYDEIRHRASSAHGLIHIGTELKSTLVRVDVDSGRIELGIP